MSKCIKFALINIRCYYVSVMIDKISRTDECIRKYTDTNTHTMEYYSATKKNEILPFATTWMELLSEITEKDKYHMILLVWN